MQTQQLAIHGHRLAVHVSGEGPVLLLIHGMAGSSRTWNRVVPTLAQRFTVVAPDLIGHGASGKPRRGEYSLAAHANILRDLLDFLGHQRATFIGQSLGGGLAMQLAYQFPERCERLVLVGSGGLGREVNLLLRALTLPGAEYVFPLACAPWLRDSGNLLASWLYNFGLRVSPVVEETWRSYASLADADTRRAFFRTLHSVVDLGGQSVSATDRLYLTSQVPTLIVWGANDPLIPASHALDAHRAMPGSRLEIFEGVGHYPHCEEPARFAQVVIDFVATTHPGCLPASSWGPLLRSGVAPHVGREPSSAEHNFPASSQLSYDA